jgi:serine/threonine-protein kinase
MTPSVGVDPRVGTEFAGYRIERLLGRGGMSVVYRAEHLRLRRKVALKLLMPDLAEDERFRERFLRESHLAASLDHSGVIPIYDAGEWEGHLYIAMRYVEGTDLRTLLAEDGPLEPRRALDVVGQVASALDVAHERGLVHRDVKPGNVLITSEGGREHIYLSDFGLTKETSSESGLTETGQFVGTADYVAPEQIDRRPVDGRADQYSLGCVLYECLTGEPPFHSERLMAVLWGHLQEEPPKASGRNPELPGAIDPVLARVLAKDPAERYGSCRELVEGARLALGVSAELPQPATVALHRRRRRLLLPLLAVLAVLVAAAAVVPVVLLTAGEQASKATTLIATDAVQRIDPQTNELEATIELADAPSAIAAGEGSVWVASRNDSSLLEIDPDTSAVQRLEFEEHGLPGTLVRVNLVMGPGSLWASVFPTGPGGGGEVAVWRLDIDSGSFQKKRTWVWGVAVGAGSVWYAEQQWCPDETEASFMIIRADSETGASTGEIPLRLGRYCSWAATAMYVDEGSVWVVLEDVSGTGAASVVLRVDPEAEALVSETPLGFLPSGAAAGAGAVWLTNELGDSVWRIDAATGRSTEISVGRNPQGIAVGEHAVWVANARDGTVSRIDPETFDIETIEVGGVPEQVAVGEGGVWVTVRPR